jgi:hypothetical protein
MKVLMNSLLALSGTVCCNWRNILQNCTWFFLSPTLSSWTVTILYRWKLIQWRIRHAVDSNKLSEAAQCWTDCLGLWIMGMHMCSMFSCILAVCGASGVFVSCTEPVIWNSVTHLMFVLWHGTLWTLKCLWKLCFITVKIYFQWTTLHKWHNVVHSSYSFWTQDCLPTISQTCSSRLLHSTHCHYTCAAIACKQIPSPVSDGLCVCICVSHMKIWGSAVNIVIGCGAG